jgi:asparagine synthase (glutamine-hydrolysing)
MYKTSTTSLSVADSLRSLMSILFGVCLREHEFVTEDQLHRLANATGRYAPDGASILTRANIGMGFQPFYTHERSKLDPHPAMTERGKILTFDGRLDNFEDLREALQLPDKQSSDSAIVLSAFERWGEDCFSRFIGDWALVLWSNADHALYLARDHAGTRSLYYEAAQGRARWSTYLDTFFTDAPAREIDEVYAANFLAGMPEGARTPYEKIRAVPAAHFIRIQGESIQRREHWTCLSPRGEIRYPSDEAYQEHFLARFKTAIERRTKGRTSVAAQLSGGMDSSSIVCMSDVLRRGAGSAACDLIDTVSHYDDSEAGWDERPFFTAVEAARGKRGMHLKTSFTDRTFTVVPKSAGQYMWPGADGSTIAQEESLARLLSGSGTRALLSGLGGDELLGGVPTGTPELADLLVQGRFATFCALAFQWCLPTRSPIICEIAETARSTWSAYFGRRRSEIAPDWASQRLKTALGSQELLLAGLLDRSRLLPSHIFAALAWESILDSLPHLRPGLLYRYELRYPYLDRDLVEFLLAIPRTQLVRPGRRRFLMRNAMKGILPDAILERRQKASVQRSPLLVLRRRQRELKELFRSPRVADMGLVDLPRVNEAFERVWSSTAVSEWPSLLRLIDFEIWLQGRP